AYVIAHEYGHHIQNLLGINEDVRQQSEGASQEEANGLSVRLELQADCFAGVWAKSAYEDQRLEQGDLAEALDAAAAVGDDAIQSQGGGSVNQESFTHGSSEQRQEWFRTGYDSGDASRCDTFA
ncbi:MAG TPA: neutral zinc metallopeptidase, partial [Aquihabitans sp.]|nr:neutral zinc metallopeptidase [Aquihabitans sp.]